MWRYVAGAIAVLLLSFGSFVLGMHRGHGEPGAISEEDVAYVQADLALSHLQDYRDLEADLSRGCAEEALAKLRARVDTQTYVLAGLRTDHPQLVEGILERRDPELLLHLRDFKSKNSDGWKEPKCTK
jgi:hypothetical protein